MSLDPILILVVLGGLIVAALMYRTRPRPKCPKCESFKVELIRKEPTKTREYYTHGGGEGSPGKMLAVHYKAQYRCRKCEHKWWTELIEH